jgi:lysophospholipase L1-like esterase
LGTVADINTDYTLNPDTFYGNYGKILDQIRKHSPNAAHVLCTIGLTSENNPFGYDIDSINDAIIKIAKHYGLPYIELNKDWFFRSSYYLNNMKSGHPTGVQYAGYAKAIERLFNKCVIENLVYFSNFPR